MPAILIRDQPGKYKGSNTWLNHCRVGMKNIKKERLVLEKGTSVYIRLPEIEDADEYIRLNRASIKFYKGLIQPTLTNKSFSNYVARCRKDDFKGFFICLKYDDAIIGSVNLSQIFYGGFKSAYMGYRIGVHFSGKGYMTEGMNLALKYAFTKMKLHRLEANIQPGNTASIALVKRLGFTKEGFSRRYLKVSGKWCDHERWAIISDDWRTK